MANKFYAVKVGRVSGIYTDVEEYRAQVDGYTGYKAKMFKSYELADTWLNDRDIQTKTVGNTEISSKSKKYYAVKIGRNPGVYTTVEDYNAQMAGYPGATGKVFKSLDDANAWLNGNEMAGAKKYYAVRVGHNPSVYTNPKEYRAQTDGYSGFEAKVFNSFDAAQEFVDAKKNNKYYAVRNGRVPGVYTDIEEYRTQIDGFPMAEGKRFKTLKEAKDWIAKKKSSAKKKNAEKEKKVSVSTNADVVENNDPIIIDTDGMIAYVDGSFNHETNKYAYGVIVLHNGEKKLLSGSDDKDGMIEMQHIAGELSGAMVAMQYAVDNSINKVTIVHDYVGVSTICSNESNPRNNGTRAYKSFYNNMAQCINIQFRKVEGHSGDYYNNLADGLARKAAGVKVKKTIADMLEAI